MKFCGSSLVSVEAEVILKVLLPKLERHVRAAVAVNRKWLVRIPREGQIAGAYLKQKPAVANSWPRSALPLGVRMPVPHMNWTYLNLGSLGE